MCAWPSKSHSQEAKDEELERCAHLTCQNAWVTVYGCLPRTVGRSVGGSYVM